MPEPNELDLQSIYGMSKTESRIYRAYSDGKDVSEISDYLNIRPQTVSNIMQSAKAKVREYEHPMQIITINQQSEGTTRRSIALLALSMIAIDQRLTEFYEGTHTIVLNNIEPKIGDADFVYQSVFTKIDPLVSNDLEARTKAKAMYAQYLHAGGKRGELGYGFAQRLFTQYYIKYDIF